MNDKKKKSRFKSGKWCEEKDNVGMKGGLEIRRLLMESNQENEVMKRSEHKMKENEERRILRGKKLKAEINLV